MSDNWNLLAKLLGTPGPAAPPKSKTADKKKQPEKVVEKSESSAPPAAPERESLDVRGSATGDAVGDGGPSAKEVLDALTSDTVSTRLPGFGVSSRDPKIDELAAGGPPAKTQPIVAELLERDESLSVSDKLFADDLPATSEPLNLDPLPDDSPWSDLAGELGISPSDEPMPHRAVSEIAAAKREPAQTPKPKRSPRGFGQGLGVDLGASADSEPMALDGFNEDDSFDDIHNHDSDVEVDDDLVELQRAATPSREPSADPFDPLSFRSFADFADDLEDEQAEPVIEKKSAPPTRERNDARREQPRQRSDFGDRDETSRRPRTSAFEEDEAFDDEGDAEEIASDESDRPQSGDGSRSRGRRGRRGQRQRMSEDAIDVSGDSLPAKQERSTRDADDRPARDDRSQRSQRPAREERAGREERPAREERAGREERPAREERAGREERPAREERAGREERPAREERAGREERPARGDRAGREERPAREERAGREERPVRDEQNSEEPRGRSRRRRGRGSENRTESAPVSRQDSRDQPQRRDAFDGLDDDDELDLPADVFGLDLDDDIVEVSEEDGDEAPSTGPRRRRRGRRGRGGRRDRPAESESVEPERSSRARHDADELDEIDEDEDEDEFEDELIPESAFDDDHEDDDEVDAIRSSSRRRRGRRGGRARSPRDSESDQSADSDSSAQLSDEEADRFRRGARNLPDDYESAPRQEDVNRRKVVPTWQEVVNLLVDNNLENHKKSGKPRTTKGKRR